jgi:hypothetical protein
MPSLDDGRQFAIGGQQLQRRMRQHQRIEMSLVLQLTRVVGDLHR